MSVETTTQQIAVVDLRRQLRAASLRAVGRALGKSVLIGLSTFVIVLLLSAWLFNEPLSVTRMAGVALICIGTIVAAQG